MLMTDCLQVVVAVVASRWRYSWPRRGSCWFWCASRSRLHGHRYRQPAAGSETCLSSGRVWWSTSPADKRCTPVQQYSKLQNVHLCNSATSFQRLSHARCSHVQKAFRDWVMLDVHLYDKLSDWLMLYIQMYNKLSDWVMLHVLLYNKLSDWVMLHVLLYNKLSDWVMLHVLLYNNLSDWVMLDIHMYNQLSDWAMLDVHQYSSATSFQRWSYAPDVHLYKFSDWVMLQMYTCTTSSQTESCSRCTPVQQALRLSHAPDVHLYNKLSDWVMLQMYTCTTSF